VSGSVPGGRDRAGGEHRLNDLHKSAVVICFTMAEMLKNRAVSVSRRSGGEDPFGLPKFKRLFIQKSDPLFRVLSASYSFPYPLNVF
jgi:hypothetical protein